MVHLLLLLLLFLLLLLVQYLPHFPLCLFLAAVAAADAVSPRRRRPMI